MQIFPGTWVSGQEISGEMSLQNNFCMITIIWCMQLSMVTNQVASHRVDGAVTCWICDGVSGIPNVAWILQVHKSTVKAS